jgi:hypothetical protein
MRGPRPASGPRGTRGPNRPSRAAASNEPTAARSARDNDAGWETYHEQMFDLSEAPNAFIRWKILSSGVNLARQLAGARNRGRAAWVAEHGQDPDAWPLPHPPAVLWMPTVASAACLRCLWLGYRGVGDPDEAAAAARGHAAEYVTADSAAARLLLREPLPVWQRDDPYDEPGPQTAG